MAPKKGLSFDEKREKLLEIFTETSEFFTLKELEKVAHKRKGIVSQSVKEVLQSLADDDLVNSDKCGNQTVFWCLPSEACQKKNAKLANLREEVSRKESTLTRLKDTLTELQNGREESEERDKQLESLVARQKRLKELNEELSRFAEFDPEHVESLNKNMSRVKDAANRWTDNVFCCQSWAVSKFGLERSEFQSNFGIPDDLDYLE